MSTIAVVATALASTAFASAAESAASASFGATADAEGAKAEAQGDTAPAASDGDATLRPEVGFQHALRFGVSLPAGESADGRGLGDDVTFRVPVMLDIGYRASHRLYFGILGVAGIDTAKDSCRLAAELAEVGSCSVEGWRLAAEVLLHPLAPGGLDLWLGAAIGWEQLEQKARGTLPTMDGGMTDGSATSGFPATLQSTDQGPALDLQAGIDFPVEGKLAAGPFIGYTGGMFVDRSVDCPEGATCASDIDEVGLHHWLTLGVRGRFGP